MGTGGWVKAETTKNKELFEAMEAIRMVLAAGEWWNSDKDVSDAIDWAWLESLDKKYPQRERTYIMLPLSDAF